MSDALAVFLGSYPVSVRKALLEAREQIRYLYPEIHEELDLPAKMLAFTYGSGYKDMICVLIPSQKHLRVGFPAGYLLKDDLQLLVGEGKKSKSLIIQKWTKREKFYFIQLLAQAHIIHSELTGTQAN